MKIDGTKETPTLEFDEVTGKIKIYGVSVGVNPNEFWDRVIETLKTYLEEPKNLELDLNLEYFNTPSATKIFAMLRLVDKKMGETNKDFTVIWHDDNDEDMRETGEDLSSMVNKNTTWVFES